MQFANQYRLWHFFQQPTWRLWGEENEKDAIFTVYLKKVRYHRPTPSASSVSMRHQFPVSLPRNVKWNSVDLQCIAFSIGFGRWDIAFGMGNGSCAFREGGNIGSFGRSPVDRWWRTREYICQCVSGYIPYICPHRTNCRFIIATIWTIACGTTAQWRIVCRTTQKESCCGAACVAGRLSGRLECYQFKENHCIHIETFVQFGGASQSVESAGAFGTGTFCSTGHAMGPRVHNNRFCTRV